MGSQRTQLSILCNSEPQKTPGPIRPWATIFNSFERAEPAGVNATLIKLVSQGCWQDHPLTGQQSCTMSLIEMNQETNDETTNQIF
jgi:hypothetical protein